MTRQEPCGFRNFGHMHVRFILLAAILISIASASAQTLRSSSADASDSSTNLTSTQQSGDATVSFGSVSEGISGAVDSTVAGYSAAIGADSTGEYIGSESSSSGGGKASSASYMTAASEAKSSSYRVAAAQSTGRLSAREGISGRLNSSTPAANAGLLASAPTGLHATLSSARSAYSPSILPAAEARLLSGNQQLSGNPQGTEYPSGFDESTGSSNDTEGFGGELRKSLDSTQLGFNSMERLCSEICGVGSGLKGQDSGSAPRTARTRLSTATNRLSGRVPGTSDASDRLLGRLTGKSSIGTGTVQGGRVGASSAFGGLQ